MAGGLLDFFRDEIARREMRQGLTDALNRGVVANTLGSVGDMAGLLGNAVRAGVGYAGHKMGLLSADRLPVLDEKPFLGSEWIGDKMRGAGMVSDRRNAPAELAATVLGSVIPTQAPKIAAGLLQAQANAAAPKTLRPDQGAVVWHGSRHKFDKFDSSKIGTGEGAQVYGHGLYLAETPDVAKNYTTAGGVSTSEGNLYKVDLPDTVVARMLDWDKPLSQQAPEVRVALTNIARNDDEVMRLFKNIGRDGPGNQAYAALTQQAARRKKYEGMRAGLDEQAARPPISYAQDVASVLLRQQGIPGIRFLDGGSRGTGTGTSNFVVFPGEEGLLQILERNGVPMR